MFLCVRKHISKLYTCPIFIKFLCMLPVALALCFSYGIAICYVHTHPFNSTLSGTTWVSRYQKSKTNLDFTAARDNEWQWHQLAHRHICTSLQTDNHASTPPLSFLQTRCPTNSVSRQSTEGKKAVKAVYEICYVLPVFIDEFAFSQNGQNRWCAKKMYTQIQQVAGIMDLTLQHIFKLTHHGAAPAPAGAEVFIYDCLCNVVHFLFRLKIWWLLHRKWFGKEKHS